MRVTVQQYISPFLRRRMIRVPYISTYSDLRRGTRLCFLCPFRHGCPPEKEYYYFLWRPPPFPAVKPQPSSRNRLDAEAKSSLANENQAHLDAGCVRRCAACVHPWCFMYVYICMDICVAGRRVVMQCGEGGVLTTKIQQGEKSGGVRVGGVGAQTCGL